MFNEAADKFWPIFEKNKIYLIRNGYVKVVKDKRYSRIKNDYSITLNQVKYFIVIISQSFLTLLV